MDFVRRVSLKPTKFRGGKECFLLRVYRRKGGKNTLVSPLGRHGHSASISAAYDHILL